MTLVLSSGGLMCLVSRGDGGGNYLVTPFFRICLNEPLVATGAGARRHKCNRNNGKVHNDIASRPTIQPLMYDPLRQECKRD
jgi:hypothetical protein